MKYEVQSRTLQSRKHTFDYDACKKKYTEYAVMDLDEFKACLKKKKKLGEIGHLCSFILWVKNKEQDEYRDTLGDCGLIHLLFHCAENDHNVELHAEYIHLLFKEDIKLS
ncbi:hypothetical protein [uncultured Aquimarina sp.]|uniref:hypothetical protein n=1 Tax=uncultured Aquimarina sp. TaxID=575652 RepID=UPI002620D6EB|nr:hypothetical protein [uncultured Aquimarina sp.]